MQGEGICRYLEIALSYQLDIAAEFYSMGLLQGTLDSIPNYEKKNLKLTCSKIYSSLNLILSSNFDIFSDIIFYRN